MVSAIPTPSRRFVVIARAPGRFVKMGWPTQAEQISCANRYASQGYHVAMADCPTDMHHRLIDNLHREQGEERACTRIIAYPAE
jgi:hypothetical protein